MRIRQEFWVWALAVIFTGIVAHAQPVRLYNGTPVRVRLTANLVTGQEVVGARVGMEVAQPVMAGGVVAIPEGAVVWGAVQAVKEGKVLRFDIEGVRLSDMRNVKLRCHPKKTTKATKDEIKVETRVGADVGARKGSMFTAYLNQDVDVDTTEDPEVPAPATPPVAPMIKATPVVSPPAPPRVAPAPPAAPEVSAPVAPPVAPVTQTTPVVPAPVPPPVAPATVPPSTARPGDHNSDYIIGPSDVLAINVWKDTELSRTVLVRPDGKISLPLIGEMQVSGLTALRVQLMISQKLQAYISDPQVAVIVQEAKSRTYTVIGKIVHPGSYALEKPTTALEAIAIAGGFLDFAKLNKIVIIRRQGDGSSIRIPFNYKKVIGAHGPDVNIDLRNGDTIVVP